MSRSEGGWYNSGIKKSEHMGGTKGKVGRRKGGRERKRWGFDPLRHIAIVPRWKYIKRVESFSFSSSFLLLCSLAEEFKEKQLIPRLDHLVGV